MKNLTDNVFATFTITLFAGLSLVTAATLIWVMMI